MIETAKDCAARTEIQRAIAGCISDRTRGRVRDLEVKASRGSIVVRGRAGSFHVKQLALSACKQIIGPLDSVKLVLQIEVDRC